MVIKYQDVEKPTQKFSDNFSAILTQVVQFFEYIRIVTFVVGAGPTGQEDH